MGSRTSRAHDAKARHVKARAVMLAERQAQDERIEGAVAAALLAIEDKCCRTGSRPSGRSGPWAAALQRLNRESVGVRDIMTMTSG